MASLSAKTQRFGLPCVTDGVKKTKKQLMSFSHYSNALFELELVVSTTSACQNTLTNCLGWLHVGIEVQLDGRTQWDTDVCSWSASIQKWIFLTQLHQAFNAEHMSLNSNSPPVTWKWICYSETNQACCAFSLLLLLLHLACVVSVNSSFKFNLCFMFAGRFNSQ